MINRIFSRLASGMFPRTCVALALLGGYTAQAEDVYVTDMLQLDMYATAEFSGSPIRKLRSGDHLSLVEERGRYVNVRADDGLVGWVKSLYLVKDEPARTRLNKLEKENGTLDATVKKLRSQLSAEQTKFSGLQEQQSGSVEARAATEQEMDRLRSDNADMTDSLAGYKSSVPVSWMLVAVFLALIGGVAAGWFLIDSRSRSRHGGYRIY
jgi:SH3 domain protein